VSGGMQGMCDCEVEQLRKGTCLPGSGAITPSDSERSTGARQGARGVGVLRVGEEELRRSHALRSRAGTGRQALQPASCRCWLLMVQTADN
jgi:hypothetical protein